MKALLSDGPTASGSAIADPRPAPFAERHFTACAAVLLTAMSVGLIAGLLLDSGTIDEPYHLRCGYTLLKTGRMDAATEHGPVAQVLSALPLLLLNPRVSPPMQVSTTPPKEMLPDPDQEFLYNNRVSAEAILIAGRAAKVILTLLLGVLIAWWTRRHFGAAPGLAALALFAFDPTFLAHGHLATTDMPAAFAFLAGCLSFNHFLTRGTLRSALWCGVVTGFAVATKYSMLLLPVLYPYLYVMQGFRLSAAGERGRHRSPGRFLKSFAMIALGMFIAIYASYGFETAPLLPPGLRAIPLSEVLTTNPFTAPVGAILSHQPSWALKVNRAAVDVPIPAPTFLRGFLFVAAHDAHLHLGYLMGKTAGAGWRYYFLVAMAVKGPTGLLALLLLALAAGVKFTLASGRRKWLISLLRARQEWLVLTIPPAAFFLLAMRSHINIGIRHILPVFPFLFILVAALLFTRGLPVLPAFFRKAAPICLALVAMESAAAFPRYIPFFNLPSGGRAHGWKYLIDSNLDWGQDMGRLQAYLAARRDAPKVCLAAFMGAPNSYYGIAEQPMPKNEAEARAQGCLIVMSKSILWGWGRFDRNYDWLRSAKPTGTIADSFWFYDFTGR